jgi:hypothetical protein
MRTKSALVSELVLELVLELLRHCFARMRKTRKQMPMQTRRSRQIVLVWAEVMSVQLWAHNASGAFAESMVPLLVPLS